MKQILPPLSFLLVLFLVSHYIFEPTYLYHELVWLDIPMHLLGGLGVGFLINGVARLRGIKVSLLQMFILFFVVAISWEVYEYLRGVIVYDALYKYLDTTKDFIVGSFGLFCAYKFTNNHPQ